MLTEFDRKGFIPKGGRGRDKWNEQRLAMEKYSK